MKNAILLILSFITINVSSQDLSKSLLFSKPKTEDVFAMNTTKTIKLHTDNQYVDLKLSPQRYQENDGVSTGLALFLGGIAFTSAAILESGDFKIYQGETARQIMLGVGIGLTITGGVISLKK